MVEEVTLAAAAVLPAATLRPGESAFPSAACSGEAKRVAFPACPEAVCPAGETRAASPV